jgi:hypothetical protein
MTNNANVLYYEINIRIDKDKILQIKTSQIDLLEFKYLKKIKIGMNQFYNFECEIIKKDSDIEIDNINLKFTIIGEENSSKSVQFASKILYNN